MKLLITGATGIVGKTLVQKLLKEGHKIHYLTTRKEKLNSLAGSTGFHWNPKLDQIDTSCFSEVDTIIHLAGATVSKRWTKKYKQEIYSSRIKPTQLLLTGLRNCQEPLQVKQLISASAIGIYPSHPYRKVEETTAVMSKSFMEKVVFDWEKEVDTFTTEGILVCKMRIGLVLSPEGGVLGTLKIPTKFGLGAAFGSGEQGQSWIHLNDLVGIFLNAIKGKWEGVYNAVSPNPLSQKELISSLAKTMKRPHFLPAIPPFLIKILVGEMSALVLDSHWVSANKVINQGYKFQYPEIQKALQNLLGRNEE